MSLAKSYCKILRQHVRMHAAWLPVSTNFELGDYGLWRGGVFTPIGNIREFDVPLMEISEGNPVTLSYVSSGTRIVHLQGGVEVSNIANVGGGEAELKLEFSKSESFYIQAPRLDSIRITNIAEIAHRLQGSKVDGRRWRLRYKVVHEIFTAECVTLLATIEKDTSVSVRGEASLVQSVESGAVNTAMQAQFSRKVGVNIIGQRGPIGLRLFRCRASGTPLLFGDEGVRGVTPDDEELPYEELGYDDDFDDDPDEDDELVT